MNKDLATALGRIDRYTDRVKKALRKGDLVTALADVAELSEISRRLWTRLEGLIREAHARKAPAEGGAVLILPKAETRQEAPLERGNGDIVSNGHLH